MAEESMRPDYLDELLFAKFAELDHNVAILREEMDRIASLLERRKRAADEAMTDLHASDVGYAYSSPGFSQETTPLSLSLHSPTIPSNDNHNQTKNRNGQTRHASGLAFHPYRRLNTRSLTSVGERTQQVPTMRAFDNVMDMLDSSTRFILSKRNYAFLTTIGKPEHHDEEPPSDPDDSIVEDAHDQIRTE